MASVNILMTSSEEQRIVRDDDKKLERAFSASDLTKILIKKGILKEEDILLNEFA
jgi:hypothetical protein